MKVKPYGFLYTVWGKRYWLLRPEPIPKDSWQNDGQQRWYVSDGIYPIHLITSFATIEYQNGLEDIWLQDLVEEVEQSSDPLVATDPEYESYINNWVVNVEDTVEA